MRGQRRAGCIAWGCRALLFLASLGGCSSSGRESGADTKWSPTGMLGYRALLVGYGSDVKVQEDVLRSIWRSMARDEGGPEGRWTLAILPDALDEPVAVALDVRVFEDGSIGLSGLAVGNEGRIKMTRMPGPER